MHPVETCADLRRQSIPECLVHQQAEVMAEDNGVKEKALTFEMISCETVILLTSNLLLSYQDRAYENISPSSPSRVFFSPLSRNFTHNPI